MKSVSSINARISFGGSLNPFNKTTKTFPIRTWNWCQHIKPPGRLSKWVRGVKPWGNNRQLNRSAGHNNFLVYRAALVIAAINVTANSIQQAISVISQSLVKLGKEIIIINRTLRNLPFKAVRYTILLKIICSNCWRFTSPGVLWTKNVYHRTCQTGCLISP